MASAGGRWGSPWTTVVGVSLALLVIPVAVWWLLPTPDPAPVISVASARSESAPTALPEVPAAERSVHGVVTDESDAPIRGARVRFETGGRIVEQTVTDAAGEYSLTKLPLEAGVIVADKEDYGLASQSVAAAEAGADDVVDLVLTRAQAVSGVVIGPNGRPVAEAFVGCEDQEDPLHGTNTDGDGRFKLSADVAGCRAVADHPSFGPSDTVILRQGDDNVLRLAGPGGIAGVVVDERGAPVASYVLAIDSYKPPPGKDTPPLIGKSQRVDDPTGAFELTPLTAGTYVLTASAEGRPPALSASIDVEAGRTTSNVRITLGTGAVLSGTVTDKETGQPVSGASIKLDAVTSTGALGVPPTSSGADGQFKLAGVPLTGRFSVRIDREGYNSSVVPGIDAGGARELRRDFQLTPGDGSTEMAGIGAVLAPLTTGIMIAGVLEGGPAEQANLQKGDRLIRIDGATVEGKSLSECIQSLRGPEGSRVSVTIQRSGELIDVTMVRALIVR